MRLCLLGSFELSRSSVPIDIPGGHVETLLKLIGVHGGTVLVDVAIEALWPDMEPQLGRRRLKNVVSRPREALGDEKVSRTGDQVGVADAVSIDLMEFDSAAREAVTLTLVA